MPRTTFAMRARTVAEEEGWTQPEQPEPEAAPEPEASQPEPTQPEPIVPTILPPGTARAFDRGFPQPEHYRNGYVAAPVAPLPIPGEKPVPSTYRPDPVRLPEVPKHDATGERMMLASVILLAFNDARPGPLRHFATAKDRREAVAFLTHESGTWAKSRRDTCDALGINPDVIRARAIRMLADPDSVETGRSLVFAKQPGRLKPRNPLDDEMLAIVKERGTVNLSDFVRELSHPEDTVRGCFKRLLDEELLVRPIFGFYAAAPSKT